MTLNEILPDILSAMIVSARQASQVWQNFFPLHVPLDTVQEDREQNNTDCKCSCNCNSVLHYGREGTVVVEEEEGIM